MTLFGQEKKIPAEIVPRRVLVADDEHPRCRVVVGSLSTVRDIKVHVHCYEGIPVDQQVLSFWGQVRGDDTTVGELDLKEGDVLNLYLKYKKSLNEVTLIIRLTVREE